MNKIAKMATSAALALILAGCAGSPTRNTNASANKAGMTGLASENSQTKISTSAKKTLKKTSTPLTPEQLAPLLKEGMPFSEATDFLPKPIASTVQPDKSSVHVYAWQGNKVVRNFGSTLGDSAKEEIPILGYFFAKKHAERDLAEEMATRGSQRTLTLIVNKDGLIERIIFDPPITAQVSPLRPPAIVGIGR